MQYIKKGHDELTGRKKPKRLRFVDFYDDIFVTEFWLGDKHFPRRIIFHYE